MVMRIQRSLLALAAVSSLLTGCHWAKNAAAPSLPKAPPATVYYESGQVAPSGSEQPTEIQDETCVE